VVPITTQLLDYFFPGGSAMKAVLQRVTSAECYVDDISIGTIDQGVVVFVGIEEGDSQGTAQDLIDDILMTRLFENDEGKMDRDLQDVKGELLLIPNFTLCADLSGGRRPSFGNAASPTEAEALFDFMVEALRDRKIETSSGEFGAMMDIDVSNDGPVTLVLET
jgi:D-tyrosyl-tRNA(Tyr) deacylase